MEEDKGFNFDQDDNVGAENPLFDHRAKINMSTYEREDMEKQARLDIQQKQIDNHLLPSEVRDKARYGGNYLNVKENQKPGFTPFYVFVSGNIESGQINENDGLCIKYDFVAGADWEIVEVSFSL